MGWTLCAYCAVWSKKIGGWLQISYRVALMVRKYASDFRILLGSVFNGYGEKNKMCTLKHCVYCNKPLGVTGKKSEEHIIQNALGGLLTSSEICCSECNNYLSRFIDAPFTKYFAPFLNYIPELNKTNKKKSIPGYPVSVEYNGKVYKGGGQKR